MTAAQENYKKSLIQKIQVSKGNVFVDDEDRKAFMLSRFGVDSTTKMTIDQLKLLCDFCNKKVSEIPLLVNNEKLIMKNEKEAMITRAQYLKILKLWKQKSRTKDENALWVFICKLIEDTPEDINQVTKHKATKVIIALENMKP